MTISGDLQTHALRQPVLPSGNQLTLARERQAKQSCALSTGLSRIIDK